eukprot:COSAG05_NODE_404_length_10192_cov_3.830377_11_plen_143_part_00
MSKQTSRSRNCFEILRLGRASQEQVEKNSPKIHSSLEGKFTVEVGRLVSGSWFFIFLSLLLATVARPEPCGAEGLGTDLGTAVRHAESRLAAMRTALDMISRGAGFSWQPPGLLQGRGGPNARTGRARAPRSAIHAFCHCLC